MLFTDHNKKVRGWIVRILERAYPAGLEAKNIHKQLCDLGYSVTEKEFWASIAYLIEDGFLEKRDFGKTSFGQDILRNEIYKLTTKGVDLAEGTVEDTGVDL